jgi:hypothetical protein
VRVRSPTSRSGSRIYLSIWDLFWALVSPILALYLRDVDVNADWSVIANYWVFSAGFAILAFFGGNQRQHQLSSPSRPGAARLSHCRNSFG